MREMIVKTEVLLPSTPDQVWDYLTCPRYTAQYMFDCMIESSWRPGAEIFWKNPDGKVVVKGLIKKLARGKTLHYTTFDPNMGWEDRPENYTLVTYELEPTSDGCHLRITQGDFAGTENAEKRFEETVQGWEYVIQGLRKLSMQ